MRFVGGLLAAIALVFAGYRGWLAMQPPEDRIRWRIEEAADGFNATRNGPVLRLFAPDYVDRALGVRRDDVRSAVASVFFTELDPETKEFLLRASVHDLEVVVDGSGATASFLVRLERRAGEGWEPAWEFALDGRLEDGDAGWRFVESTVQTRSGEIPGAGLRRALGR